MSRARKTVALNLVVFALYFSTARLGLKLGSISGFATLVWPPTGIALAALMLGGPLLWPGIAAASFAVNLSMGAPLLVALAMSVGNTGEAIVGAALLKRSSFEPSFRKIRFATDF